MKSMKIGAISLFTGCGGLDIGSHMAGIPVVGALEIDQDCVRTLQRNRIFKDTAIFNEDITEFEIKKLKVLLNKRKFDKVILMGGPPCQPFSKAGYWVGHNRRLGVKDPRNLISNYFDVVKELMPDGFLLENVESLLHPKHKIMIDYIVKHMKRMRYDYRIIHANALDFGVPQKRKRIFIFGSKRKFLFDEPKKTHCPPKMVNGNGLKPYESVYRFIKKFDSDKYFEKYEVTDKGTYGNELKRVPPGKNYIALSERGECSRPIFEAGKRFWSFLLKLHPEMPSWTIAAQPGPWVGPFHWTSRRLRVPEIAALQTFPEDFEFYGSRRSIQRQIGNAVPPKLAKAMIEFLRENI
ncbi:MAG: DNA (cytosine-5-)-methyltransferase [Omnitrophica WOR_2 bacterium GWA2_47_8]|nr:MAG: DNA (cytosine-5-)-methyltransferase [Omnitrophica WOR_2 bacterium GWA2_47_8]